MSNKSVQTFHNIDSSLLGFYCWKNDRRTWTTDSNLARLFSTRLWVNDDFDFDRILPVFPCTKRMQWTRMLLSLLPRYVRLSTHTRESCLTFATVIAACGTWFLRHRALAFGIMVSGSSIGGVVLPIMVQHLIPKIGFGWTMRAVAFMFLGLLIIANLTIKSRLAPARRPFHFMELVKPFMERPFLLLALAAFFIYFGGFLPFNFLILQGEASGMSTNMASYLVPILNGVS
jgi:hypothetical protein